MSRRRGVVLLEVLVALLLVMTAGTALIGVLGAAMGSERGLRDRERTLAAADRVLAAMTLLTRLDLDQRLGHRVVGEFVVDVERPAPTLYRIAVAETRAPDFEDLVTVVYRPRDPHAR